MKILTKEEILEKMKDIIPFKISDEIIPYIKEAMELYKNQTEEIKLPAPTIQYEDDKWKWVHGCRVGFKAALNTYSAGEPGDISELWDIVESYYRDIFSDIPFKKRVELRTEMKQLFSITRKSANRRTPSNSTDAVQFAEWINKEGYREYDGYDRWISVQHSNDVYETKELYELFIKSKKQ